MKSKFYGAPVINIWAGTVRYGIVRDSKECNGWAYLKCDWIGDDAYENDIDRVCQLRNVERKDDWIRVDKVRFININKHINKLSKLSYAVKEVDGSADYSYYLTSDSNYWKDFTDLM